MGLSQVPCTGIREEPYCQHPWHYNYQLDQVGQAVWNTVMVKTQVKVQEAERKTRREPSVLRKQGLGTK